MNACILWRILVACCLVSPAAQALEVRLEQVSSGPIQTGTAVSWTADADQAQLEYQFSVSWAGQGFAMVHDFSDRTNHFEWTPMKEGAYTVRVIVRSPGGSEMASAESDFQVESRLGDDGQPVVSETAHPLVFLYSGPPCDARAMSVVFGKTDSLEDPSMTHAMTCDGTSMNFWIAGLEAATDYTARYRLWNDVGEQVYESEPVSFRTGTAPGPFGNMRVLRQETRAMDGRSGLLLQSQMINPAPGVNVGATPIAHKLDGTLVWYYDAAAHGQVNNLLRPLGEGLMMVAADGLRIIDLMGNTVWETDVDAVNPKLAAMGQPPLTTFHHDAIVLPNGMVLGLAASRRLVPGAGPEAPSRNVTGDVLVLLDREGNVRWVWDAFEKLDLNKKAILGEMSGRGGNATEDWTHGNALQYLPDGNILFSIRHLDWVVKIDFQDGAGSGDVIWRMGKDGDFAIESTDPYPWFSHQHDPHFDGIRLWVYDNGNTRCAVATSDCNSRGQVYLINEDARSATIEMNSDLGVYSPALGSAQRLGNGNYHFLSGNLLDVTTQTFTSQSVEVSPDSPNGPILYIMQAPAASYRSFRVNDLYQSGQ